MKCPLCKQEIYSNSTHDMEYCECKNIYVDGGFEYLRTGYKTLPGTPVSREFPNDAPHYFKDEHHKKRRKRGRR